MKQWCIPITTVAVFDVEQSETLVESTATASMIDTHLHPVVDQAQWIAEHVKRGDQGLHEAAELESFVMGSLAAHLSYPVLESLLKLARPTYGIDLGAVSLLKIGQTERRESSGLC